MEKVDERIKRSVAWSTVAQVLSTLRLTMVSIFPPLPRSLARFWDHRIDQHQQCNSHLFAHERRSEAGQRLCDEDDAFCIPIANRADDGGSILRKTGPIICRRQFDRDSLMTVLLQLWRDQVPVPRASTRARNKDKGEAL